MAQDTTPALVLYVGDGVQTRFDVPFDKGPFGEIKVAFVRRGLTDYTWGPDTYSVDGYLYAWNGGVYTKTLTVDTDTPLYDKEGVATGDTWTEGMYREPKNDIFTNAYIEWTGDPITADDVICIVRITEKDQPYSYPNNQKHIERALDHLSRQIQELQNASENALFVDPSWNYTLDDERKMDPIHWLQTIVRSKGLTLREVRIDNGYIEYTTDDPDSETKAWEVIAGVKTGNAGVVSHIRETRVLAEDGTTWIPYLEYSVDGGNSWKPAGRGQSELESLYVKKAGDTMSGTLQFSYGDTSGGAISGNENGLTFRRITSGGSLAPLTSMTISRFAPQISEMDLGGAANSNKWQRVYAKNLNNGYDITVPATNSADTLALKSEVDLAANSGDQLTAKGVWYAKMYAATVVPTGAEYDGRNYADFSQVDGNGDPIIVIYEGQSGTWVQTDTITPPANYNGYVTVTSKIWDIPEQAGQQGGKVLWSHNQKTFTPYPQIISFEDAALTGNSTVAMPLNPTNDNIANKGYVDSAIASALPAATTWDLFDFKWKDCTMSRTGWALSDGNWINKVDAETAYQHLYDEWDALKETVWIAVIVNEGYWYRNVTLDQVGDAHPYAFSNAFGENVVYCDVEQPEVHTDALYDGSSSAATSIGTLTGGGREDWVVWMYKETIAGTTIPYMVAADGHKIVYSDNKSDVDAVYAATGVAWYYILDRSNERFVLPRTQHAFVGYRDTVGAYVEPTLPNIKSSLVGGIGSPSGAMYSDGTVASAYSEAGGGSDNRIRFDASHSSSIYKDGAKLQPAATQAYLYFYIGQ